MSRLGLFVLRETLALAALASVGAVAFIWLA